MKNYIRGGSAALALTALLAAHLALAEEKSSAPKMDPQMAEMMKKAEAAGMPGAGHKALEPLVGNWKGEVKMWMSPGAPPTVTKAKAKSKWIMNGRFIQEEFEGEFMGKPFRGISLTGYDNMKKKYGNVWIDDMHTSLFTSEGEGSGDVFTFEGKMDCPITGQKDKPMKQVIRIINRDKHVFEMHDPSMGTNSKTMEIVYTRR